MDSFYFVEPLLFILPVLCPVRGAGDGPGPGLILWASQRDWRVTEVRGRASGALSQLCPMEGSSFHLGAQGQLGEEADLR